MGQAFRRASARIRATTTTDATSPWSKPKTVVDRKPPPVGPTIKEKISKAGDGEPGAAIDSDGIMARNPDNVLEERDPNYDVMLGQMVGRITTKPGGKLEMGEASVVDRYKRPLPKLRNTKPDSSSFEDRPTPSGTLNIAQLRHIVLLHEGKAEDHDGPMDVQQIAKKYRVDVAEVQRILQFISLPPEEEKKERNNF
ncbi:dynein beta chain, ciliary protein [Parasponia andersonii]|uniref:Dynein beta chain, ciliary protein n=1 Tax=Parasponia andersonii TaxID=3476 RepID=A0A2P5E470_PARAD|nr:dynein beta chain, ciliary protein [Parasponia andersonii]